MRKKDDKVGDKYGYKKKGKRPKRERERKIRRDPQKRPMRMREKQAASLHPISQKYTLHVAKINFSHSHAY